MLIYETIAYLTNQKTPTMIIQNSGSASKKTCLVFCVCKELHGFSGENVLKYASWKNVYQIKNEIFLYTVDLLASHLLGFLTIICFTWLLFLFFIYRHILGEVIGIYC